MIKLYNVKLDSIENIEIGKTYHKDPTFTGFLAELPKIKVLSHSGGIATVQIGEDTFVQSITSAEAHAYINHQGGYHDTP